MSEFEEGLKLVEKKFGGGKDNLISVATIALEPGEGGKPCPVVRDVDAFYEDGVFFVTTWAQSAKMLQVANNAEVAFSVCGKWFNGSATGENLGWVLKPENAELRQKLRAAFSKWYDMANKEDDQNCCIFAIRIKKAVLNIGHWKKLYHMDFTTKTCG